MGKDRKPRQESQHCSMRMPLFSFLTTRRGKEVLHINVRNDILLPLEEVNEWSGQFGPGVKQASGCIW
jgi:hypothetical protein